MSRKVITTKQPPTHHEYKRRQDETVKRLREAIEARPKTPRQTVYAGAIARADLAQKLNFRISG